MADAILIYTADRRSAADRLRSAIAEAGYSVGSDAGSASEKLESASAVIVIWSKDALASDALLAAAGEARRQGKLIEVTMDGIKPAGTVDAELRVALLSGWRGQPFHPGWQKLQSELKRLCKAPRSAPARTGAKPSEAAPGAAAAGLQPRLPEARLLVAAAAALLLILGTGALWPTIQRSWSDRAPPPSAEDRPVPAAGAQRPGPDRPQAGSLGASQPAPIAAAPAPPSDRPQREALQPDKAAGTERKQPAGQPGRSRRAASSPSETMRLFCERSGRGTRECRAYLRRRGGEASAAASRLAASAGANAAPVTYRYSANMRRFCEGAGRSTPECRLFRRRARAGD
jgi:hypothetical protein